MEFVFRSKNYLLHNALLSKIKVSVDQKLWNLNPTSCYNRKLPLKFCFIENVTGHIIRLRVATTVVATVVLQ